MSIYLTEVLHAFLPLAMVAGLLVALTTPPLRLADLRIPALVLLVGIVSGWLAYDLAVSQGAEVRVRSALRIAELCALGLALVVLFVPFPALWRRIGIVGIAFIMAMGATHAMRQGTADAIFTSTSILNSELIANTTAVLVGMGLVAAMAVFLAHLGRAVPLTARIVLLVVVALVGALAAADALLGGLQLGFIGATSGRVRLVAQAGYYGAALSYVLLGLSLLVALAYGLRQYRARDLSAPANIPQARKRRANALAIRRWISATTGVAVFFVAALLYHDLYASQPPRLSKAAPAVPDAQDQVRIAVDQVKDGRLHRYAYIAEDGHRVRFFLINRYDEDHVKIGVVFDACMICGDDGYIQKGNDVICIACNVHIFVPSIGKAGGCNPIPLTHEVEGDEIVITRASLERGAKYFSEIVAITVTDPVSGAELINLDAPYQYEFRGHTFFFESKDNYELFKADPEQYAADTPARSWRVEGFQSEGG